MQKDIEKEFYDFNYEMDAYREASALIAWDMRTGAPKKSIHKRSQVLSLLSKKQFEMATGEEMARYLEELSNPEAQNQLQEMTKHLVKECRKEFDRMCKIPPDEYKEYVELQSNAESAWEEAKEASDFPAFLPYLQQIVDYNKKFIQYWGVEDHPYNALLDLYEPGMTVEVLDKVFAQLREEIVPLVKRIGSASKKLNTEFIYHKFDQKGQEKFCLDVLKDFGYDFDAGRLDVTVHPFQTTLNAYDTRITTKYDESDFRVAVFGTIHECGHAMYEQNIDKALQGTPLCSGTSMGMHESQSLFFENFLARNRSFWKRYFNQLKEASPEQFSHVDESDFFEAINEARPSLIRIEADELTYCLHIMIRYELEKAIFNGEIEVSELPALWNEKYKEYLGIEPDSNANGVLQDVHWAGGLFGYFPSYALGYMYAAQLKAAMLRDIPNFDELVELGEFHVITKWLKENVHQFGKTKMPNEIIMDATGEALNPNYLIEYLKEKYENIYEL